MPTTLFRHPPKRKCHSYMTISEKLFESSSLVKENM
jgi:hypothetical protein